MRYAGARRKYSSVLVESLDQKVDNKSHMMGIQMSTYSYLSSEYISDPVILAYKCHI